MRVRDYEFYEVRSNLGKKNEELQIRGNLDRCQNLLDKTYHPSRGKLYLVRVTVLRAFKPSKAEDALAEFHEKGGKTLDQVEAELAPSQHDHRTWAGNPYARYGNPQISRALLRSWGARLFARQASRIRLPLRDAL